MIDVSQLITRVIRTVVPFAVGVLISVGIDVEAELIEETLAFWLGSTWYILFTWLEERYPWVGWLLGRPKKPVYDLNA